MPYNQEKNSSVGTWIFLHSWNKLIQYFKILTTKKVEDSDTFYEFYHTYKKLDISNLIQTI